MKLLTFASLSLFISTAAASAAAVETPHVTLSHVDWDAAAASISDRGANSADSAFAKLNVVTGKRFLGIAKSAVPVLLPIDIEAFRKDASAKQNDATTSDKYFGNFRPSKFFLAGPAGYSATFFIDPADAGFNFDYTKRPIEVEITGAAFTYDLDPPDHQEVFTPKALESQYPGIRRILRDAHVRYAFERFGVPYVVSIQCYDQPPSAKYLSCREADPIAEQFLRALHTAGGTPARIEQPKVDLSRPKTVSDSFTYYEPGNLIPDTGWNKLPGRADNHVYARIRFPIANGPAYLKSQSFMPWGDCYRGAHIGRMGKKGSIYRCKVNGIPLVFDESAAVNFS
ncbi:MAG TPA: M23 family peptidase, partial [Pseudolabrys sp.]|nr:M23 family peptidase [Pseudolabrys sp.]